MRLFDEQMCLFDERICLFDEGIAAAGIAFAPSNTKMSLWLEPNKDSLSQ